LTLKKETLCFDGKGFIPSETGCYERAKSGAMLPGSTLVSDKSFWAISIGSGPNKDAAEKLPELYYRLGLPTGVLWIPDYGSLSGAKLWLAYVGPVPYANREQARQLLAQVKVYDKSAYCIKVSKTGKRETLR
jgi:hypothetical protein